MIIIVEVYTKPLDMKVQILVYLPQTYQSLGESHPGVLLTYKQINEVTINFCPCNKST